MLYKVIAWRFFSIALTYLVTYVLTGDVKEAVGFTALLQAVLLMAHYIFEISWDKYVSKNN